MASEGPTRRELARGALWSSLGAALGSAGCAPQGAHLGPLPMAPLVPGVPHGAHTNARVLGAVGDGLTDDTPSLTLAVRHAQQSDHALYLPPGVYHLATDLELPPDITCMWAPGAVLAPAPGVTLRVGCGITAGLHPIFRAPAGAVKLTGHTLTAVYPEWWGARGAALDELAATDATDALTAALRAAHADRWEHGKSRPCIPVALSSTYRVTRPLVIESNPNGFRLVGAQPVGSANLGAPTLYGDFPLAPGVTPPPLLTVRGVFGWSLEHVNLHAGPGVGACLHLEADVGRVSQSVAITRCSFVAHAQATSLARLVHVGHATGRDADISGDDLCSLTFDSCYFDLQGRTDVSPGPVPDGVVLRAANALAMLFTGCFFGGRARRFITCGACTFGLVACVFHNTEPTGCDVYLEAPGLAHPGAFTAFQCESQSWQFLDTHTTAPLTVSAWPTVLVGVRHANVNAPQPRSTSIRWDSAGWCGTLLLVGCRLGGDVLLGPYATAVMDLGTGFTPHSHPLPDGALQPGPGFRGQLAALRGLTGLTAHPTHGTHGAMVTNALRVGANLVRLGTAVPTAESVPPPWTPGDVWLRAGLAPTSTGTPTEGSTLAVPLHAVWVTRGSHQAWEDVFGSENYTGPYVRRHDPATGVVTLDTAVIPVAGAVYELLWDLPLAAVPSPESSARAVGRHTMLVHGDALGSRLAVSAQVPDGAQGVTVTARFIHGVTTAPTSSVPRDTLATHRLQLMFSGVPHDPDTRLRAVLRRLL